jgi:hypothetical protein
MLVGYPCSEQTNRSVPGYTGCARDVVPEFLPEGSLIL